MKVLIVHHKTFGLAQDARILRECLLSNYPDAEVAIRVVDFWFGNDPNLTFLVGRELGGKKATFDFTFFLEHTYLEPRSFQKDRFGTCVYIPNIEWVNAKDETALLSGAIDVVLFKTKHAESTARGREAFNGVPSRAFIGWTSEDARLPDVSMRFDRALHVRGLSMLKQTETVFETWVRHGAILPPLEVFAQVNDPFSLPAPATVGGNTVLHLGVQKSDRIRSALNSRGLHLCPSSAEGFGHYLNEARSVGAVVITTDAPPMNEFVRDGESGFLVPATPAPATNDLYVERQVIAPSDLLETMERVLIYSDADLRQLGHNARLAYETEKAEFLTRFANVLEGLAKRQASTSIRNALGIFRR